MPTEPCAVAISVQLVFCGLERVGGNGCVLHPYTGEITDGYVVVGKSSWCLMRSDSAELHDAA